MESFGVAGSKWSVFTKGVTFLLGAFVGVAENWDWGIPACEVQAEQTSPLQNQIPFLAPWILPRGEVCEAQGHLALHGNKVSFLSNMLIFAPLLPFHVPYGSLHVYYCSFQSSSSCRGACRSIYAVAFYVLNKTVKSVSFWQCRIVSKADLSHVSSEEPYKQHLIPYLWMLKYLLASKMFECFRYLLVLSLNRTKPFLPKLLFRKSIREGAFFPPASFLMSGQIGVVKSRTFNDKGILKAIFVLQKDFIDFFMLGSFI